MQALRAASGEPTTGGSSIADLRKGIAARYGYTPPPAVSGFSVLWTAVNGRVAVVQGSMKAFGLDNHYSRFDPHFDGAHAVFIYRPTDEDRVWWCDPEAPSTYDGEWMSKSDLSKFVNAFAGQHLVGPILGENMIPKAITSEAEATMTVPANTPAYDLDGTTKIGTFSTILTGRFSPSAYGTQRSMYATIGGIRRLVLVTPLLGSIRAVTDATPFSQVSLDAAAAEGITKGVASERTRLRNLLGL
jgi:hypothetical protein